MRRRCSWGRFCACSRGTAQVRREPQLRSALHSTRQIRAAAHNCNDQSTVREADFARLRRRHAVSGESDCRDACRADGDGHGRGHAQRLARFRHQARRERTAANFPARYQVLRGPVPQHDPKQDFSSRDQPFQTFLWSDYHASRGTSYDFTIIALYGDIRAFEERHTLTFSIKTEPEFDQGHGVFFNRGTIASHAFKTTFNNKPLTDEMTENVSDDGKVLDPETAWLSRGLAEACLKYKTRSAARGCASARTSSPISRFARAKARYRSRRGRTDRLSRHQEG